MISKRAKEKEESRIKCSTQLCRSIYTIIPVVRNKEKGAGESGIDRSTWKARLIRKNDDYENTTNLGQA